LHQYFDSNKALPHEIRVTDKEWTSQLVSAQDLTTYAAAMAASASFRFFPARENTFQSEVKFVDGELSLTKEDKNKRLCIPLPCNKWHWWKKNYYIVMGLCCDFSEYLFETGYKDIHNHVCFHLAEMSVKGA
jgi:hypothetical protein